MKRVFAPGCALIIYKPHLAVETLEFLQANFDVEGEHLTCCRHEPGLAKGTTIVNTCSGCDRRYRELYDGIDTVSLWEVLAASAAFPFPDYRGETMSILDACPTRNQPRVLQAVRTLARRMNIRLVEPERTGAQGTCCGDSYYGKFPVERVKEKMRDRASEMPAEDVVVYCVSCCKAMHIGGKKPRYLLDLLYGEATEPRTYEPDEWHRELSAFIKEH